MESVELLMSNEIMKKCYCSSNKNDPTFLDKCLRHREARVTRDENACLCVSVALCRIFTALTLVTPIRVALAACAKSKKTIKTKGTVQIRARSRCVEATECVRYLAPVQEMLPLLLPSMEGILRCSSLEGKQRVCRPNASFRAKMMTAFITLK